MTSSTAIRGELVEIFRRDLVGPLPWDADIARERLNTNPARWYLTGFLAPADDAPESDDPLVQEEMDIEAASAIGAGAGGAAGDEEDAEKPGSSRRLFPSSVGLTVLLPIEVAEVDVVVTWGDYVTEPPLPEGVLIDERSGGKDGSAPRTVDWVRVPRQSSVRLPIPHSGRSRHLLPESASLMKRGGALQLDVHAREFHFETPSGAVEHVRAVTIFLVNRRACADGRGH
ncbi:hypothetical protein [Caenispirillum bisanense]|uniref:hypothetical protein n=1 Tax=Caenispirillum bisanense TaxID=414052 RepID=UPI0031D9DA0F